ncbi:MAG TPA: primosomal protein N' [Abditibacteriaceae bacterium]|jgi:primosomal protein N' (replication factor Y)
MSFAPRECSYVSVVLDRTAAIDKELTYGIPDSLRAEIQVGTAVLVPAGRQQATGFVTGFPDSIEFDAGQLRNVAQVLAPPLFNNHALAVARWMSAYYHCSLADALCCWIPPNATQTAHKIYRFIAADPMRVLRDLVRSPKRLAVAQLLANSTGLSLKQIEKECGNARDALKFLVEGGIVSEEEEVKEAAMKPRRVLAVRALADPDWPTLERAAPKQAAALRELEVREKSTVLSELAALGFDAAVFRALEKKGLVAFEATEVRRAPLDDLPPGAPLEAPPAQLSADQNTAIARIGDALRDADEKQNAQTVLLHGVTASGKTEVYLAAIEECLRRGRRAVVLVPEIALTAQTVEIFQRRFGERVAILHSALGAGERFDEWRRSQSGEADIVVGARSAVFAPCENVGLWVIDEEHDGSYKQDQTPRYHARDVALRRAQMENSVVLLGSATPCLESYRRAQKDEWIYVSMPTRVAQRALPEVEIVDLTGEAKGGSIPVLSRRLGDELVETVGRGEQAIIFLNRRGFAVYVQCLGCGHVEKCPNCDVSLTYHRGEQTLRCHHCDHAAPVISACPECDGWMIGFSGTGTEKVESEIAALLEKRGCKNVPILRLDRDTTSRKGAHAKILGDFRARRANVLIGTQMVTKGLDFPGVTLVGVISADSALNMPDFRASERTFQLLAQVAGRAGRGDKSGKVIIQTLDPDHYSVAAARDHDYETFVKQELEFRGSPPYPPFSHIVNIVSSDEEEKMALMRLQKLSLAFAAKIETLGGGTEILGPVDCPVSRVKNKYRFHLMLRDRNKPRLHKVLGVYDELSQGDKAGLMVDVDASSLL